MARKEASPLQLLVVGVFSFIIGVGILGYMIYEYHDWEVVSVTYTESNCVEEKNVSRKKGESATSTYCDLTTSYEYNGKTYSTTKSHEHHNWRPGIRSVNPANPQQTQENWLYHLVGWIFTLTGGACLYVGIKRKIKSGSWMD